jgi:radical SAM-linked protein
MKIAFGPALPVGTAGQREYLDIWLVEYVPADELLARWASVMPAGLRPTQACFVSAAGPSLSAICTVAEYVLTLSGEGVEEQRVGKALDQLVRAGTLSVEHKGKTKVFDLTRCLPKEPRVRSQEGSTVVDVTVKMGQDGSLRPEALLAAAFTLGDIVGAVRTVTRIDTLIEDDGCLVRPI